MIFRAAAVAALLSGCVASSGGEADASTAPACPTLPTSINFGAVARGDIQTRLLEIPNTGLSEAVATIGPFTSPNGDQSMFTSAVIPSTLTIAPFKTRSIEIAFKPFFANKGFIASITVRPAAHCPEQTVSLGGLGVAAVVTVGPNPLDFGFVPVGIERIRELSFTNLSQKPVVITDIRVGRPGYRILSPQPVDVPPASSVTVQVAVKPTALDDMAALLLFQTDLIKQPTGMVHLRCEGGGPDIDANRPLDFGSIAYFAGASSFATRILTLRNEGTRPMSRDARANLHLGANGVFWEVRVKPSVPGNTATADELCVGEVFNGMCNSAPRPGAYDLALGIEATPAAALEVPVRVTPKSIGSKDWELVVHSDDSDEPQFVVPIHADAVVLPPCDFEVSAQALSFGVVAAGSWRDLAVTIKNKGQNAAEVCSISGLAIAPGSHPAFSIIGGPINALMLQPQASKTIVVRYAPTGPIPTMPAPVVGTLQFSISNPASPHVSLPLTGAMATSCLTFVPNRIDFGTVQRTCSSATRTVLVYNTCAAPVDVVASSVASTEFLPVDTTGISLGTMLTNTAAPATFSLKYRPIDDGFDSNAFVITVAQAGENVEYVIPLSGTGDLQGLNVDTLANAGNPKADLLWVIDNSCSMQAPQQAVVSAFPVFFTFANTTGIDYQLGVTSTDMGATGGKLIGNPKILTPAIPNIADILAPRIKLGVNGSATAEILASATAAVTAPLISTHNAGFVRDGATLGILSLSDANDQSPQTVSAYVGQLLGVKPPGQVAFSAIAPLQANPPFGCFYDGPGGAPRTLAAVTALSGVARDICGSSMNQVLQDIVPTALGFTARRSLVLTAVPDLTAGKSIVVKLDGQVLSSTLANGFVVWSHDPIANRLLFDSNYAPQPGQAVTATYIVPCLP